MFIRLETSSGVPISRQIADQIRAHCASGALAPGARLPSVRALAADLAVNHNTVLHVYERLTIEGLLERRHGDGTYVAGRIPARRLEAGQMALLGKDIAALAYKAATLNVPPAAVHRLVDEAFARLAPPDQPAPKSKGKTP